MTITTDAAVADLIERLQEHLCDCGDPNDAPSINAGALARAHLHTVGLTISDLRNLPHDLARRQTHLDDLLIVRAEVDAKRDALQAELGVLPDPETFSDRGERDHAEAHAQHLRMALRRLDEGTLAKSPSETYARADVLGAQIEETTKRIDGLRARLDAAIARGTAIVTTGARATSTPPAADPLTATS